jgi:PEP-CTERM motif-containing protein
MRKIGLAVLALAICPALASATPFVVDAKLNSTTGGTGVATLVFNAGDAFSVSVDPTDLWNAGALPRWSNADGLTGPRLATGSDDSLEPAGTLIGDNFFTWNQGGLTAPFGTLVGSFDNGINFFAIGTTFAGTAPVSGTLRLYYFDSNFEDNTEHITADVAAVPEPGTLSLIGAGLLALARRRRRA